MVRESLGSAFQIIPSSRRPLGTACYSSFCFYGSKGQRDILLAEAQEPPTPTISVVILPDLSISTSSIFPTVFWLLS